MAAPTTTAPTANGGELDRVLRAEREAEEAVDAARAEAERTIEEARERARAIGRRTEERIARARIACAEQTEREIEALRAAEEDRTERVERLSEQAGSRDAAVARVAAWLLGTSEDRR